MDLFRPVGLLEMQRIIASDWRAFPPRLPEQPIFYPVLNLDYARQIARDWNTQRASYAGYVTQFTIDDAYGDRFDPHIVGARQHAELWIPAEDLATFNAHILPPIQMVAAYFGSSFTGLVPDHGVLQSRDAYALLSILTNTLTSSPSNLHDILRINRPAIVLHFPFWMAYRQAGLLTTTEQSTLDALHHEWETFMPAQHLCQEGHLVP